MMDLATVSYAGAKNVSKICTVVQKPTKYAQSCRNGTQTRHTSTHVDIQHNKVSKHATPQSI